MCDCKGAKYYKKPHRLLGAAFIGTILLVQAKLLVEAADTATGIHHFLLAGVEGVTLRAHFYADILLGGASLDHVAAGAPNRGLLIVGMEAFLHCMFTSFSLEDRFINASVIIP